LRSRAIAASAAIDRRRTRAESPDQKMRTDTSFDGGLTPQPLRARMRA
jgi:hypothetical protein